MRGFKNTVSCSAAGLLTDLVISPFQHRLLEQSSPYSKDTTDAPENASHRHSQIHLQPLLLGLLFVLEETL